MKSLSNDIVASMYVIYDFIYILRMMGLGVLHSEEVSILCMDYELSKVMK